MIIRRRTQSKEPNILASSKPAMQKGTLLSLNRVKLSSYDPGLDEMATVGHVRVVDVPEISMTGVSPGKLTKILVSLLESMTRLQVL